MEAEDAFDMPDDVFRQHFRPRKETVRWLCDEVAEELGGVRSTALSVERQVLCALRFFATGSFQGSVGSEETIGVTQPAVSKCVRRVAEAIVHAGTRNKWVHYPRTSEEKAAVKEGFLRHGGIPGVIGCVDGSLIAIIAPKGDNKAAYMCRKGFYALNMFVSIVMFV
ncbi:putative nuclease HARBI1 [Dermacentor silvarum]|uniref:putative nuclease HARBI1 n=1 Tax=Dermacentor silvarum TaxID=543639 RepID=UPI0021012A86|nr:putative nuclease HARBI1 [Dermacentor silvarum]